MQLICLYIYRMKILFFFFPKVQFTSDILTYRITTKYNFSDVNFEKTATLQSPQLDFFAVVLEIQTVVECITVGFFFLSVIWP